MEDNALYRPVIKRAWQTVFKFKNLWFFGLFAAILGAGGEYEILTRAMVNPRDGIIAGMINSFKLGLENGLVTGQDLWHNFFSTIAKQPGNFSLTILILVIGLAISLFILWLAIISQIGLIKNCSSAAKGKGATVNEGINFAVKNFWPVLLVNAGAKIIFSIIFIILGWLVLILTAKSYGLVAYCCAFIIFLAIVFMISFVARYQIYYILLKKQKLATALDSAWELFKKNWLISLETAFILFAVYLASVVLALFFASLLIAIPLVMLFYLPQAPMFFASSVAILSLLLVLAEILLIVAFTSAFQWTAWTILFEKLTGGDGVSKIVRGAEAIRGYFGKK